KATGLSGAELAHLASLATPPPLEVLGVYANDEVSRAAFPRLRLPSLIRLVFQGGEVDPDAMVGWEHLAIMELAASTNIDHIASWYRSFSRSASLRRLELEADRWRIVLTRDELVAMRSHGYDDNIGALAAAIAGIPPLATIRIGPSARSWRVPS